MRGTSTIRSLNTLFERHSIDAAIILRSQPGQIIRFQGWCTLRSKGIA